MIQHNITEKSAATISACHYLLLAAATFWTGLPLVLPPIILLPFDEKIEVLKHYFGITFDNELVVRGIEIRRHDIPAFIKRFQTQLLYALFDCKDSSEILTEGYENALLLVTQAIDTKS